MIMVTPLFAKTAVFKMFSVRMHENKKPAFSNFSGLKSVFEKLRFRDGFSVDGWPNPVGMKLRFQIYPAYYGRCHSLSVFLVGCYNLPSSVLQNQIIIIIIADIGPVSVCGLI